MSLIKVDPCGADDHFHALCAVCGKSVGIFDVGELADMARQGVIVTCFDCDPLYADKVPSVLRLDEEWYLLCVDGQPFLAEWGGDKHFLHPINWSLWATLLSGFKPKDSLFLSSSTYLNATEGPIGG